MVYNAVSSQVIINRVYRDLPIDDPSFEMDAIEWIGETLEKIGAGVQAVSKESWEVVTDHKVRLPSDTIQLQGLYAIDDAPLKNDYQSKEMPYDLDSIGDKQRYLIPRGTSQLSIALGEDGTNHLYEKNDSSVNPTGKNQKYPTKKGEEYYVNGNYIQTTFPRGLVIIAYKGIPTDNDGLPLIPDDPSFLDACFWYVTNRLQLRGWKHPRNEINLQYTEQRFLKYINQARNKAKYPDVDQMEQIKQLWLQLVNQREYNTSTFRGRIDDGRDETTTFRVTEDDVYRITD